MKEPTGEKKAGVYTLKAQVMSKDLWVFCSLNLLHAHA
jgi:hypothetical protein